MRIGERSSTAIAHLIRVFILMAVFVMGLWLGAKTGGIQITLPERRPSSSPTGSNALPLLTIDMSFANYNTLLQQRETALDAGVYIPRDADFVTATLKVEGFPYGVLDDTTPPVIPINMRFVAGVSDYLADDAKWEFEVRTRQQQHLWGMQRLQLRDPADNNWINEWLFAQTLRRAGLLAARYHFVRLVFNGDDRGIYAVQEGFAEDLFLAQGREAGVIVEFDTDLLWQSIAHFETASQAYADPISNLSADNFQLFEVNAFRDAQIDRNPTLAAQRNCALGLLRALQTGELPASQVFNVEHYGRFLALVDLWEATQATTLTNLRYYYDPTTARLEPIGFNAHALGSESRVDLAVTYNDAQLQEAYVREVNRVSQAEYIDALQTALEPAFRDLQSALGGEGITLAPPWEQLRERQKIIRRSLNPVQPVFAFLGDSRLAMSNTLSVAIGNIVNVPVEIVGFDINGTAFLPVERQWLRPASETLLALPETDTLLLRAFDATQTPVIRYMYIDIPLTAIHRVDVEADFMQEPEVAVVVRLAGLSQTHLVPVRYELPDVFVAMETE